MLTAFNLFTSISWILAGIISAIISALFFLKNPKKRLNQLFSCGFIFWSLSLFFNGLSFSIAYKSLSASNITRDLCVIAGILSAIILFVAAIGIYFGVESLHWLLYLISFIITIILIGIGVVNDWVVVDNLGGYKTTDNLTGKICIQIFPALFVIIGALLLTITYFKLESKLAKKRIGYFTLGFLTIIIGLLMFLIDALLDISPYIFPSFAIISWVIGPALMLIGLNVKIDVDSKVLNKEVRAVLDPKTLEPKIELEKPS